MQYGIYFGLGGGCLNLINLLGNFYSFEFQPELMTFFMSLIIIPGFSQLSEMNHVFDKLKVEYPEAFK